MGEVFLEMIVSIDFAIWFLVGVGAGFLAGQFIKGGGYGMMGNIAVGITGSVISGFAFDWLNFMDIGDLADPLIAGLVGATILLTIAALLRREENNISQKTPIT